MNIIPQINLPKNVVIYVDRTPRTVEQLNQTLAILTLVGMKW